MTAHASRSGPNFKQCIITSLGLNEINIPSRPILVDPVFVTLQKTIDLHNLTDHVAVVKAVMCVNVSALAVGSMAGYCYAGWMLLGWLDVVTLAVFKLTVWQFFTLAIFKLLLLWLAGYC